MDVEWGGAVHYCDEIALSFHVLVEQGASSDADRLRVAYTITLDGWMQSLRTPRRVVAHRLLLRLRVARGWNMDFLVHNRTVQPCAEYNLKSRCVRSRQDQNILAEHVGETSDFCPDHYTVKQV